MQVDVYVCDDLDNEYHVYLEYYPGSPGRTYGPPENCYPPEPASIDSAEFYIVSNHDRSETRAPNQDELYEIFKDTLYDKVDDAAQALLEPDE